MYNNLEITKLPTELSAMNNYDQLDPRSKLTRPKNAKDAM